MAVQDKADMSEFQMGVAHEATSCGAVRLKKAVMIPPRPTWRCPMREKPTVLAREIVARSRLFAVEELQLRFSNGVERTYERLASRGSGYGAVMIVAMQDAEHAVLIEEYCAGTD